MYAYQYTYMYTYIHTHTHTFTHTFTQNSNKTKAHSATKTWKIKQTSVSAAEIGMMEHASSSSSSSSSLWQLWEVRYAHYSDIYIRRNWGFVTHYARTLAWNILYYATTRFQHVGALLLCMSHICWVRVIGFLIWHHTYIRAYIERACNTLCVCMSTTSVDTQRRHHSEIFHMVNLYYTRAPE